MQKVFKRFLSLALVALMSLGITAIVNGGAKGLIIADADTDYYSSITASSGTALLGQLHDLITTTHNTYTSYSDCSNPTYVKQTDPGSNSSYVMEFYSQADISSTWGSGAVGTWNREHLWCQSLSNGLWNNVSNSTRSGGSDMHHIRPAESALNSTRGNNKYGEISNRENNKVYYKDTSKNPVAIGGYNSGGVFEPLDEVKGDVARIILYVYTHYNTYTNSIFGGNAKTNGSASCFGTLNFTHVVSAGSEAAAISLLLEWNKSDPVSQVEITRNNVVYGIQGNRNPFVDNPDYADAIWGDGTVTPVPSELKSLSMNKSTLTLTEGKSEQLSVTANPADASASVSWTSSNEEVASVSSSGVVTAKSAGTATITATSTVNSSITATAQVTVNKSSYNVATITLDSFDLTNGYNFKSWSAGELSGIAYIYGGSSLYPASSGMQFNKNQPSYYIASTKAASGPIKSITVKSYEGTADRDWKLLTADTPYGEVTGKPTNGTDQGTKTVTQEGVTWTLSGEDTYFALTYEFTGGTSTSAAAYLDSIVVEYGEAEDTSGGNENQPGGDKQPDIDNNKLQQFHTAVENIVTNGTLGDRLASINNAIKIYQTLTDDEKSSAASDIRQLQDAIEDYNKDVRSYNDDAANANKGAYGG